MATEIAVKAALDLLLLPTRVKAARFEPLPCGIEGLLRIVSGDREFIDGIADATGRAPEVLHEAAAFFIEQVMLNHESDLYRNLGSSPDASGHELRNRMALLMQWLHPDKGASSARNALAGRVMEAWHTLSNAERRAAYDARLEAARLTIAPVHSTGNRERALERPFAIPNPSKRRRLLSLFRAFMLGDRCSSP